VRYLTILILTLTEGFFTLTGLSPHLRGCFNTPFLFEKNKKPFSEQFMPKTQAQIAVQEDLKIDLTFHNFSVGLLKEFAERIIKPYFEGNTTAAIQTLMEKAIAEENMFNQAIKR
jgi:hypothetical protein